LRVPTIVDVHTHFVPSVFPPAAGRTRLWPSIANQGNNSAVMVDGKVFRVIDDRSWNADRRLADMKDDGIDLQVVSPMPELLSHWFPAGDADALASHINQEIASLCNAHPKHFVGIGMVPIQDVALAAKRLSDVKAMGLCGVEIGTHINGVALGATALDEFYAAAEAADLCVMIHPLHPSGMERISGRPELAAVAAFPLETALAATSLLTHGITERFPKLRILLSHGGGALPWLLPRMKHAVSLGPPLQSLFAREPHAMAASFFYDTVLYDAGALRFLADQVGTEHLVIGSDYPFTIKQDRPAQFAAAALDVPPSRFTAATEQLLNRVFTT
jgi:aminocarboxymuconate-semialdehyde decarboxylase